MNNGKYFSIMDLARLDLMIRSGFIRITRKHGWYPVIASEMIRFKQSLLPFRRFEVRTQLIGWSERYFYIKQSFVYEGEIVAIGVVRIRFLSKKGGTVNAHTIAETIAPGQTSPELPGYLHNWQHAERDYTM
jgi:acyl-CoA thioesterase FadM